MEPLDSEAELADIASARAGDAGAYARLVGRYQGVVTKQMWRFTRDRVELEILVQEVFVAAWMGLPKYRAQAPFLHWLRRVATYTGYDYWKRQERDRTRRAALEGERSLAEPPSADMEPPEAAGYLYDLLAQLPAKERLVLTLMYFDECSTQEIAERIGWSRSLVKVRAFRARKKLRAQLEAAGYRSTHDVGPDG